MSEKNLILPEGVAAGIEAYVRAAIKQHINTETERYTITVHSHNIGSYALAVIAKPMTRFDIEMKDLEEE